MRIQPLALGVLAALAFLPLVVHAQATPVTAPAMELPTMPVLPATAPAAAPAVTLPAATMPAPLPPAVEAPAEVSAKAPAVSTKKATTKKKKSKKAKAKAKEVSTVSKADEKSVAAKASAATGPNCIATARVSTQNYPGAKVIPTTNNLLQPTGKALEADGQKIIITGRVLDAQCAPVPGAIVELWQNSPTGRWLLAGAQDLASAGKVFAGAGRTYTDHEGKFTFVTAFPAPLGNKAPFVNVKVSGQGLSDLSTALYFSDDTRNESDATYKKLAGTARSDVTIKVAEGEEGALLGAIDLVLSGKAPYRTY